jgi:ABC-2 type transport system permease protein
MADAIRSEWIKLRTTRANIVLLLLALFVPVLLTALVTGTAPLDTLPDDTPANRFSLALAGAGIGDTLLGVLGVLVIGSEYRHNTIRVTFAAVPRRLRVHWAKAVTVAAVSLVVGLVAVSSSYLVGSVILGARDHGVSLSDSGVPRSLVGAVVLAVLQGLVGLGVGTIIRATAGAITLLVVYPVVVEALLVTFVPSVGKYLPFAAGTALQSSDGATDVLSPLAGGAIFVAFTAALLIVGGWLLQSRDA